MTMTTTIDWAVMTMMRVLLCDVEVVDLQCYETHYFHLHHVHLNEPSSILPRALPFHYSHHKIHQQHQEFL